MRKGAEDNRKCEYCLRSSNLDISRDNSCRQMLGFLCGIPVFFLSDVLLHTFLETPFVSVIGKTVRSSSGICD